MNVFDYALELEKEGEKIYTDYAESAPEKGMATIFKELAAQEKKHYEIFQKMKTNDDVKPIESEYLKNIKDVFADWRENKDSFQFDIEQAKIYHKALTIEQKSIDLYTQTAAEAADQKQKEVLLNIAEEEKKHKAIIENLIAFMEKPDRWVEHAMFTKVGEEY